MSALVCTDTHETWVYMINIQGYTRNVYLEIIKCNSFAENQSPKSDILVWAFLPEKSKKKNGYMTHVLYPEI